MIGVGLGEKRWQMRDFPRPEWLIAIADEP